MGREGWPPPTPPPHAAVPGHLSNLHDNARLMWASSTDYCNLFLCGWQDSLPQISKFLSSSTHRVGTQGWASDADGIVRMDSLWDIESLDTASGEETGKVFLAQSQSETTGKTADLPRLAESTKHDTFDVVRGFASLRAVDVDVDVGMGRALEFSWWCGGGVGGSGGHHGNNNLVVNAPSALPAALFFSQSAMRWLIRA
ncbi:hypothetical protein CSOJ01_00753 [Colletotrichum sojae]|uniref:Uncharacterized protein n=1 Tax=Colletotrichum sojae TaxID=2175907 RepID=A0A8H6JW57_9PEZI|nr:hypothetical protein CSOJ01_00753 [Colletotrichum sojae]